MSQRGTLLQRIGVLQRAFPAWSWDTCERFARAEMEDARLEQARLRRDQETARRPDRRGKPFALRPLSGFPDQPAVFSGGSIHRLGDADEAETALPMQTKSLRWHASQVEAVFREICREETGSVETPEETAKRKAKERKLLGQADIVCAGLTRAGKLAYRADSWDMWAFDVNECVFTDIPSYRRICVNPWIAYRLRLPYLNWLEYWMQDHPFCRFWTFTSGERCRVDALDARIKDLNRRISRLNGQKFMKAVGAEIVFRSDELGTVERTDRKRKFADVEEAAGGIETDEGGHWYHPHAHCVVWLKKGKISEGRWSLLLSQIGRWWGHNWDEGKRIRDVRECVKYIVKPWDIVRLAETDCDELGRLHEVLFRKKLIQPMGELARMMRAAKKAKLVPQRRWKGNRRRWTLIVDHNKSFVSDGSESSGLKGSDGSDMTNSTARRFLSMEHYGLPTGEPLPVTRILARCAPAFNDRGVKSPRVVGCGIRDVNTLLSHPLVKRLRSATAEAYSVGLAMARIRVHTGTPTVPPGTRLFTDPEVVDPPGGPPGPVLAVSDEKK